MDKYYYRLSSIVYTFSSKKSGGQVLHCITSFMFRHLHKYTASVTTNYLALFNQNESDVWTNMEANHAALWILPAG